MYEHVSYHKDWAISLKEEIAQDAEHDWFHPLGKPLDSEGNPQKGIGDFDYGRMKFVNRNINYYYFENILLHAIKNNYEYNPAFPKCLEFCRFVGNMMNETGPFGRMCIWKLSGKAYLLPHYDRWEYHRHIKRYIFCISEQEGADALINIEGKTIEVKQGLLFSFNPATEKHEFANYLDSDWNFLGFDFWQPDLLEQAVNRLGTTKDTKLLYTEGYGAKKQEYLSQH